MSLKIGSALVGLSLVACLAAAGTLVVPSQALAQTDCSRLDTNTQAWVNCARRQTNQIRSNIRKQDEDCHLRGRCGPNKTQQQQINKQNNPRLREANED